MAVNDIDLSFWSAMMKTWQELPKTRENKVATAAFKNIVIDPSLQNFKSKHCHFLARF